MAEDEKQICHAKSKQKKAAMAILIIGKIDVKTKCIPKDQERFCNDESHFIRKTIIMTVCVLKNSFKIHEAKINRIK